MRTLTRGLIFFSLWIFGIHSPAYGQLFNFNPPTITGQRPTPLITEKNTPITIAFQNLRVTDPDFFAPQYPEGYTLTVSPGNNYSVANTTVTPDNNFAGTLTVKVQVNDGKFNSNIFDLKIDVINDKPEIKDHETISIKEGANFTIALSHLKVEDNDNEYPADFSLTVYDGPNHNVAGNTITPIANFTGNLKVLVSVNDGTDESNKFEVTIEVRPNIVPVIKGHSPLEISQGNQITIKLDHLVVDDPDNSYPTGFMLKVFDGSFYNISGATVIPNGNFVGKLKVPVTVHDGLDESKKFEVEIVVNENKNVAPVISGQKALLTNEDQPITISLNDLRVTDPDNNYPDDFVLRIPQGSGQHYTVAGNRITPAAHYNGTISVPVKVNDGHDDSDSFNLIISITPVNDIPVITGQDPVKIPSGKTTILQVSSLKVSDPDTANTSYFTLKILPGSNYTASGNSITPNPGFTTGKLTVKVVVNDGVVDSAPFNLIVDVIPPGPKPLITGQQPLVMLEDASLEIKLSDLFVTDADDPYPTGFTLTIHPGADYSYEATTVTPRLNIYGMLTVNVTVNDGDQNSDPFELKIYVIPVNDPPAITRIEDITIPYEPGSGPVQVTEKFEVDDVDSDYLTFAEVGIVDTSFSPLHDELIFENTDKIRGIYDPSRGIMSLIGSATLSAYDSAIRSIKYNYVLTLDEDGQHMEVLPGLKRVFISVSDGQLSSSEAYRLINIESSVDLDIPNTFTPNGDKSNDTWRIRPSLNARQFDKAVIRVYNKRGLLIYEGKGFEKSWDGYFNGEKLPVDTYYFTIDLKLSYTNKTYKGTVMILY